MANESADPLTATRRAEEREDAAFGKIAIRRGVLTSKQLKSALADQRRKTEGGERVRLGQLLVSQDKITREQFLEVLNEQNKTILTCPTCAAQYNVKSQPAGKRMRCKHCKEVLTVPAEIETLSVRDGLHGPTSTDPGDAEDTRTFGNYAVTEEIARGGMGIVFRAKQFGVGREVALKVLKRERMKSPEYLERFFREARLAGQLNHPNIVPIYEVGELDDEPYFAMAYVEGKSLEEVLRGPGLPKNRAMELIEIIAGAIHYAHQNGIVHRDLKPGNILIDEDGRPMLTDFGLAKHLEGKSLTQSGIDIGTPHYMSPEQVLGKVAEIDERSDVYALGVLLYQVLTRRLPFGGKSAIEIYHKILNGTPRPPSKLKRGLPRDLDAVCAKAMSREAGNRYPTAEAFAKDVTRLRLGEQISARPPSTFVRASAVLKRHQVGAIAAAFCLLTALLGVGLWLSGTGWGRTKAVAPSPEKGDTTAKVVEKEEPGEEKGTSTGTPVRATTGVEKAQTLVLKAKTALHKYDFASVMSLCREALVFDKDSFEAHYLIGRVHYAERRYLDAELAFTETLKLNPYYSDAIYIRGFCRFMRDQFDDARSDFSRLIALPKDRRTQRVLSEAYRMRGRCHYHLRKDDEAIFDYEKASEIWADNHWAYHQLGILYFARQKNYQQGKAMFDTVLRKRPGFVPSLLFRGACLAYLNELDKAFDDFSAAYDRDPQWVHEFIEMGLEASHHDPKRYDFDPEEAKRFLKQFSERVMALMAAGQLKGYKFQLYLGLYNHYIKKYEQARTCLTQALKLAPFDKKRKIYIFRGQSNGMLGAHEQAIADFSAALKTQPDDLFGRLHRAVSYLETGRLDDAEKDLAVVLRLDASEVRGYLHLAMIAMLRKRWDEAKRQLDAAIRVAPTDSRPYSLYAWFRCKAPAPHRDLDEALRQAHGGIQRNRKLSLSWGMSGVVFEAQGDRDQAERQYQKALESKPTHWYFDSAFYKKRLGE